MSNPDNDSTVRMFIGWLSGDIPELHSVEVPRLAASWERFKYTQAKTSETHMSNDNTNGCSPAGTFRDSGRESVVQALSKDAAESPARVTVPISASAAETLRCLFFHGPTWDGNVPSKSGRDELVDMKLAQRGQGWQWLTRLGVDACFAAGIHNEKDRRDARERKRKILLYEAARQVLAYVDPSALERVRVEMPAGQVTHA